MNKAMIVLIPTAVGLGVGLLLATRQYEPNQRVAAKQVIVRENVGPDHGPELQQLRREVRALSEEQGEQEVSLELVPPSEDVNVVEAGSAPALAPDLQAESDANMAALVEQAQALDRWFYEQDSDPNWTLTAEDSLYGAFSELEGLAFEADCAAAACRLELGFKDADIRDSTMSQVPFLLPWAGEGFVATLDEEGLAITVYVAREGTSLPRAS